ncbi:hypothetical protein JT55_02710 [Rhodovulum sp. NI22]|nr:hypothetical protein JT55_02710 [Rhodovulum sp. NI22]
MLTSFLAGQTEPIARIVHIGAGAGTELPAYLATGASSVLLVEARAEAAAELALATGTDPRIETLQGAVSADPTPRPFFQTNFPELDSLNPPTEALRELFPGLRILSDKKIAPLDPVTLLQDRPLDAEGQQILVLETPGETLGLLQALADADLLHHFETIFLKDWLQPLYLNAAPAEQILAYLGEQDFQITPEARPEDPDRPWVAAHLNQAALTHRRNAETLSKELQAAQAQIAAITETHDQANKALTQRQTDLDAAQAQIAALTGERDQARQALAQRTDDLTTAQAQITALIGDRDSARNTLKTRDDELASAKEQIAMLIAEREKNRKATEQRLQQSRDEMLKAEGQLRLLKDLMVSRESL